MDEFFYNKDEVAFFSKTYFALFVFGIIFLISFLILGIKEEIKIHSEKQIKTEQNKTKVNSK